jgi:hypothetical protein
LVQLLAGLRQLIKDSGTGGGLAPPSAHRGVADGGYRGRLFKKLFEDTAIEGVPGALAERPFVTRARALIFLEAS